MRLMTGVAGHPAGVLGGDHLWKTAGLGGVLFMAAPAEIGDIRAFRDVGGGIVGVLGEGPVAGLAGDVRMLAGFAGVSLVVVAHDAGILAGIGDGPLPYGGERARAVVAVLAEVLGDHRAADRQEKAESGQEDDGRANEMSRVVKQTAQ